MWHATRCCLGVVPENRRGGGVCVCVRSVSCGANNARNQLKSYVTGARRAGKLDCQSNARAIGGVDVTRPNRRHKHGTMRCDDHFDVVSVERYGRRISMITRSSLLLAVGLSVCV